MPNNPFADFSFESQETPTISNDDITRVLKEMNPPAMSQVDGGTSAGIARVNQNTRETGTVAYKDNKGQAVLTNVARDASGQERPIAALFRNPEPGNTNPNFVSNEQKPSLFQAFQKLQKAQTPEEAEAIYSSLLETVAAEATRLENEAYQFAENKFGIPEMQRQITEARQLDKQDPLYAPGMGDSIITQKLVDSLRLLSSSAAEDAKGFLKRNMTYNSLATLRGNAEREYQRFQKQAERKANFDASVEVSRQTAEINRRANQQIRQEDRQARREEEADRIYNSLTPTQIQRLTTLNAGDVASIENEQQRRMKIADLAAGAIKDKKMQEAVSAESDEQLVQYALNGNGVAKKLVVMEESMRTGRSVQEVEEMFKSLSLKMQDQRLAINVLNRQKGLSNTEKGEKLALLNPALYDLNPNRKIQADALRTQLVLADARYQIQQQFLGDVTSWGSSDPTLLAAIDKAKKVAGAADISSVLTAYVGDASNTERKARLDEFNKLMKNAALRQKDSMFGAPNWREAEKIVITQVVNQGFFSDLVKGVKRADREMSPPQWSTERTGLAENTPMFGMLSLAGKAANFFVPDPENKGK